jgi:membrane-bound ClpP family serine protease
MHPTVALWIIGIALVVASWYIPSGTGFLVLGVLALIFGTVLGLRSR